jgi:hypothetical protein
MSDKTIIELISGLCEDIGPFYKASGNELEVWISTYFTCFIEIESVALLDVLSGFTYLAKERGYVRPEFNDTVRTTYDYLFCSCSC